MANILTEVVTVITNEKLIQENGYGISIINLPEIDYSYFVQNLRENFIVELYFLGYGSEMKKKIENSIPNKTGVTIHFTVEEAEESRNAGIEGVFRIHFIKNSELEKISSLRWYEVIDVDLVYKRSCRYVQQKLPNINQTIKFLLQALGRRDIRELLNFERVLDYLNALLESDPARLPYEVEDKIYLLGLLMNPGFCTGNPSLDKIKDSIKQNFDAVRRISSIDKNDRQNIASYLVKNPNDRVVRLVLDYYAEPRVELLKEMNLKEVQKCLKTVSKVKKPGVRKKSGENPVAAASGMVFDERDDLIDRFVDEAASKIDERTDKNKPLNVAVEIDGRQIDFPVHPTTEKLVDISVAEDIWGKYIFADVSNPQDAIDNSNKYNEQKNFDKEYVEEVLKYLERAKEFSEAENVASAIIKAFQDFLEFRKQLQGYAIRLQDMPMLQVLSKSKQFIEYLEAYERLIFAIKDGYSTLSELDSMGAKQVISAIVSLDFVYIIGRENCHALPTPLNPLYLWKYIKLSQEIIESRGVPEGNVGFLSDDDKDFIMRKSEEIPDPLALVMLPKNCETTIECLPYVGKLGNIPVYSSTPQISNNKSGLDAVCQSIVRYMCLYPHSGIMLHLCFVNPPSVESVVTMLKDLDKNKDFMNFGQVGIDLTIYRTKETSSDWVEIQDKSLNEGMLGKIKGKNSDRFYLSVKNKCMTYSEVIEDISREQHIIVLFDPNERNIESARNEKNIQIHPLCVPKVYEYNKMRGDVRVRPANEGGIFSDYAAIIEKLYDQPSTFGHRNVFVNTPLRQNTYEKMLQKADWLIILDQNLKSWDISLQSASERLYFKNDDYRSIGIYSRNSRKFIQGYREIVSELGNYSPDDAGIYQIVEVTRTVNDDGLLSLISHSSNQIFDQNHGKGSLGLAIAALRYKRRHPQAVIVGLDTQLAQQWLAERDDGKLPDLIGITFEFNDDANARVDLIEVKTYSDYLLDSGHTISGHAVEQAGILDNLIREMFGHSEKVTTVSRREILREQVFEYIFASNNIGANEKQKLCERLNKLFAGNCSVDVHRNINHIEFDSIQSSEILCKDDIGNDYLLSIVGAEEIQAIITSSASFIYDEVTTLVHSTDYEEKGVGDEVASISLEEPQISKVEPVGTEARVLGADKIRSVVENDAVEVDLFENHEKCVRLNVVLKNYGIHAKPVDERLVQNANRFTRFKIELMPGETEANLTKRKEDIARELEAAGEIFISRVKGTRYIAIDVPFTGSRKPLLLKEYMNLLKERNGQLNFVGGQEPDGSIRIVDLEAAPHMLVAGTTGSGKSVFLNSIIVSLADTHSVDELEFILVDPKQMEFYFYENLPHIRNSKILTDPEEAIEMLEHVRTVDMPERIKKIQSSKSKTILQHNEKCMYDKLKYLVIIIDEYSALVNAASLKGKKVRDEFEKNLCTLVFMARSYGIHLIVATQYPTATYVTPAVKSNLPFRVSFRLPSHTDSMTILDRTGAEDLLGNGDMLMLTDEGISRMQGCYISEEDIENIVHKNSR